MVRTLGDAFASGRRQGEGAARQTGVVVDTEAEPFADDRVIDMGGHFEHVDRQLDIHITLDPPTPHRVRELFGRLGDHRVTVIVKPINKWPYW